MRERIDPVFVALASWPVLWHVVAGLGAWWLPDPWRWPVVAAWIILVPPLLCFLTGRLFSRQGQFAPHQWPARLWWWHAQLQAPFNRLPWFEEILRLLPGVYQLWLRAWGGDVALTCVIGPGVVITDRQHVRIGRGAVLGASCVVTGHLVWRDPPHADGTPAPWTIAIAPVTIGAGAVVGGRAGLGPGSTVAPGECLPALQPLPPFHHWKGGRRHKPDAS